MTVFHDPVSNPHAFYEIIEAIDEDPEKVRLRWLGDYNTTTEIESQYVRNIPRHFEHYIVGGSTVSKSELDIYVDELEQKLKRDPSQTVLRRHDGIFRISMHDLMTPTRHFVSHCEQFPNIIDAQIQEMSETEGVSMEEKITVRVLARNMIWISHHVDAGLLTQIRSQHPYLQQITDSVSTKQSFYPLQRPLLRIHSFPDELTFLEQGSELHSEIMNDPKQITLILPSMPSVPANRFSLYWLPFPKHVIIRPSERLGLLFLMKLSAAVQQQVQNQWLKSCASPVSCRHFTSFFLCIFQVDLEHNVHCLLSFMQHFPGLLTEVLSSMETIPEYKSQFAKMGAKIKKFTATHLMIRIPLRQLVNVTLSERKEIIDSFMEKWKNATITELKVKKEIKFWSFFGSALVKLGATKLEKEYGNDAWRLQIYALMARDVIVWWSAMEHFLDPSYTLNVILYSRSMMKMFDSMLLMEACEEEGCSWIELEPYLQFVGKQQA